MLKGREPLSPESGCSLRGDLVKTVLVVDDDPQTATMLRWLLEDDGYRVVLARDGREGLRLAATEHPDLVLSDILMPIMNGLELARRIQEDPLLQNLRIVLMSTAIVPEQDGLVYEAFIRKPFDLDSLLETVSRLTSAPAP